MANTDKNIDKYFKDQLENYEVKPSGLAWERLENKLDKNKKPAYPWMKIAASIMLLLTMGSLIWLSIDFTKSQVELPIAVIEDKTSETESETVVGEEVPEIAPKPADVAPSKQQLEPATKKESTTAKSPVKNAETPKRDLVADNEAPVVREKPELSPIGAIERVQPEVELPITGDVFLAEHTTPEVRVKIISSGIVEKPQKENLIDDLGEKIEKVGSLINKVDQGFADLQDAKNNLFASITSKRERNSN
ncbi:MAG TPA: hypothetical protein VK921_14465 [Anditalea sp.]|nr:hypothetical protein [Anditalea sp.]